MSMSPKRDVLHVADELRLVTLSFSLGVRTGCLVGSAVRVFLRCTRRIVGLGDAVPDHRYAGLALPAGSIDLQVVVQGVDHVVVTTKGMSASLVSLNSSYKTWH